MHVLESNFFYLPVCNAFPFGRISFLPPPSTLWGTPFLVALVCFDAKGALIEDVMSYGVIANIDRMPQ